MSDLDPSSREPIDVRKREKPSTGCLGGGVTGFVLLALTVFRLANVATRTDVPKPVTFPKINLPQVNLPQIAPDRLVADLRAPDAPTRQRATLLLGMRANDPLVAEALTAATKDPDEKVRMAASVALSQGGPETVRAVFAELRREGTIDRASLAVSVFGTDGHGRAAVLFAADRLGGREKPSNRLMVLGMALGRLKDEAHQPALEATNDPDRRVRLVAIYSLYEMPGQRQQKGVAALEQQLGHLDSETRRAAAISLGATICEPAREALLRGSKDPKPSARVAACTGLAASSQRCRGKIATSFDKEPGDAEARRRLLKEWTDHLSPTAEVLAALLTDDEESVRRAAAWALACLPRSLRKGAEERLREALGDQSKAVRVWAADALIDLGDEPKKVAEPVLRGCVKDPDADVRKAAAEGLTRGRQGDVDRSILEKDADDNPERERR